MSIVKQLDKRSGIFLYFSNNIIRKILCIINLTIFYTNLWIIIVQTCFML